MSRSMSRVGDLIGDALPSRNGERLVRLIRAWPGIVGDAIACEAWPARITSNEVLVVHVTSAVWASELTHLADDLQARVAQTMGDSAPRSVLFRVGTVPQAAPSVTRPRLAQPSQRDFDRAAHEARAIPDPILRRAAETAFARALARQAQEP